MSTGIQLVTANHTAHDRAAPADVLAGRTLARNLRVADRGRVGVGGTAGTGGDHYGKLDAVARSRGARDWDRDNPLQLVGRKAPNALGLHNMLGNVWESV